MCVTICGRFLPDEGAVAGYGNRIRVKYTAKWGVQIAGMIFQTHSRPAYLFYSIFINYCCSQKKTGYGYRILPWLFIFCFSYISA